MKNLLIIGRAERIDLPDFALERVPAKVDTGADSSSLWASDITENADGLHFCLFGPSSRLYTGKKVTIPKNKYTITRVANSFGHKEFRYKVKVRIGVKGRVIRSTVTLSDRTNKTYPILLGRRMLHNKFVVDVAQGEPLSELEKRNRVRLSKVLKKVTEN